MDLGGVFFSREDTRRDLKDFLRRIRLSEQTDDHVSRLLDVCRETISAMESDPEAWDERCSFNIDHIGKPFLEALRDFDYSKPRIIERLYIFCYRFICEFDFFVGPGSQMSMNLLSLKEKVQDNPGWLSEPMRYQIFQSSYLMPVNMLKSFVNNEGVLAFKNFVQTKNEAESLRQDWDKDLSSRQAAVESLRDKLKEYEIGFNFVGLYKGFSDLARQKVIESKWLLGWLVVMGVAIITPLVFEAFFVATNKEVFSVLSLENVFLALPLISIEIILIYFFRVILMNYRSVKGQVDQIELRKTLCQFIQSYSDYSGKIKKNDFVALEKFENLIFSAVLSDPGKIPSTYDGFDSFGDLIKNIKN